jgi:peptide/nickel transport system permease protein
LPNVLASVIVATTLAIANGILIEANLSFLGLGDPTQPSWGKMLNAAQSHTILRSRWWLWVPPGLSIALCTLSINFVGDGLRDALDPYSTK